MINTLIGQKLDQTQKFLQDGRRIPVTEIAMADNVVVQVKSLEKDKYAAAQLGYGVRKKSVRALAGHAKKAGLDQSPRTLKEVSLSGVSEAEMPKTGDMITVDAVFKPGDIIAVTGTSKGKGFAGAVKRYNFRGGPKTHGQSDRHRAPGSIGQGTTPGRVYKGKRMAGRMGTDQVTVANLTVVDVDADAKKLYVLGLVPGHKNAYVTITRTGEMKNFIPLLESEEKKLAREQAEAAAKAAEEAAVAETQAQPPAEESKTEEVKIEEPKVEEKQEEVKKEEK